jgi:cysteine synthase B
MSSGANVYAATQVARKIVEKGGTGLVVTILADGATKYLSESFWNDQD